MGRPITWQNVNIDAGEGSAALGQAASNFGRTAQQGFDSLFHQTQDRITREDALRTNEAITQALRGGSTTSDDRRVDATMLQTAVERNLAGVRDQEAHKDTLLSNAVSRAYTEAGTRLTGLRSDELGKRLTTWDADHQLEQDLRREELNLRKVQTKEAQDRLNTIARIRTGRRLLNEYIYGPEITAQAEQAWLKNLEDNPDLATQYNEMSPDLQAFMKERAMNSYRQSLFRDPGQAEAIYLRFDLDPIEAEQYTVFGQTAKAAREAEQEIFVNRQSLLNAKTEEVRSNAKSAITQKQFRTFRDGQWSWGNDGTATGAIKRDVAGRHGWTEEIYGDDKDSDYIDFFNAVEAKFPGALAFPAAVDALMAKGAEPGKRSTWQTELDLLDKQLEQKAKDESVLQDDISNSGTGDWRYDFRESIAAYQSRTGTEDSKKAVGEAIANDPEAAIEHVLSLGTEKSTSKQEANEIRDELADFVAGFKVAAKTIKLPDDAPKEVRKLHRDFQEQVRIADGGPYIPKGASFGANAAVISPLSRVRKAKFPQRKEAAAEAALMFYDLQKELAILEAKRKQDEIDLGLELD